jgi:hypothetical protein
MKTALALIILCLTTAASLIPLEWDAPEGGVAEGYAVWVSKDGGAFTWNQSIASLQADITGLAPGTYDIYVTATLLGVHSDPSNTLRVTIPAGPSNLRTRGIALMGSPDMLNWHVVAFYEVPDDERAFYKIAFTQTNR